jgi:hypothetical protein
VDVTSPWGPFVFEWLSVPARQAVVEAHEAARLAGRSTIATGDLVVGLLRAEGGVARDVLARAADLDGLEIAARSPESLPETDDLLRMVLCAAVGVAAARGTRHIGTGSLLLGLAALEPPGLARLCDAVGVQLADLSAAVRRTDDASEFRVAAGDGEWGVTVGEADEPGAWTDPLE